jgi:hypothetical protein
MDGLLIRDSQASLDYNRGVVPLYRCEFLDQVLFGSKSEKQKR